jgi:hypothetical protein
MEAAEVNNIKNILFMERLKSGFPSDLTDDYSPSIPKEFPKDRIPS